MIFAIITLLSALFISAVAAYYSIVGLTTLFSGAVLAITVMGIALELGKIVTATWLHKNWDIAPTLLKTYLTTAVFVLMLITSMGIFGYLSKAHLTEVGSISKTETSLSTIEFKIEQKEKLISQEKGSIASAEKVLEQLDASMDEYFKRGIISKALKERKIQEPERAEMKLIVDTANKKISEINEEIGALTSEQFDLKQEVKNFEVEVGPIKYLADLIYGEEKAKGLLDETIRYVILLLIFVFDPLAILMIIAANISFLNLKPKEPVPPTSSSAPEVKGPVDEPEAPSEPLKKKRAMPTLSTWSPSIKAVPVKKAVKKDSSDDDTVLAVPGEIATRIKLPVVEKESLDSPIEPMALSEEAQVPIPPVRKIDVDQITKDILSKSSNSGAIPFNFSAGDVGAAMKQIITDSIQSEIDKQEK